MSAIDRAVAHFNAIEIRSLSVEEWGDESGPLVIYAKPLTLNESQKLYRLSKNNELELLAYALIPLIQINGVYILAASLYAIVFLLTLRLAIRSNSKPSMTG